MGQPKYGPGIIGQEEYDRQLAEFKANPGKYGPGVTGKPVRKPQPAPTVPDEPTEGTSVSVKQIKALLAEDGGLNTQILEAELQRPDGPRKSALREVAKAERLKDAPNPGLLDRVEAILEGME